MAALPAEFCSVLSWPGGKCRETRRPQERLGPGSGATGSAGAVGLVTDLSSGHPCTTELHALRLDGQGGGTWSHGALGWVPVLPLTSDLSQVAEIA